MHAQLSGERQVVHQRVTTAHGVHAVGGDSCKAQLGRGGVAVDGEPAAGKCATAQGALPRRIEGEPQAAVVAVEHPGIGQQVVGQAHRLRALQVGVAGHEGVHVLAGAVHQRAHQVGQGLLLRLGTAPHPQERVGDHLVVAAAARVQAATGVACDLGEATLDRRVDVLITGLEHEGAGFELGLHLPEAGVDGVGIGLRNDSPCPEHSGMRPRSADVLPPHALVHGQRRVECIERLG